MLRLLIYRSLLPCLLLACQLDSYAQCELSIRQTRVSYDCEAMTIDVSMDLLHFGLGDSVIIALDGSPLAVIPYSPFSFMTVNLAGLPLSDSTTLGFIDQVDTTCFADTVLILGPCIDSTDCDVTNWVIEVDSCDFDRTYWVDMEFNHINSGTDSFELYINDQLDAKYGFNELPLLGVEVLSSLDQPDRFTICLNDVPECCFTQLVEVPDCLDAPSCALSNISVSYSCVGDSFSLLVDLNWSNTSDSFLLRGNGQEYGIFAYADLPIDLGPFHETSLVNELVAIDVQHTDCRIDTGFTVDCSPDCAIDALMVEDSCVGDVYYLLVDFTSMNTGDSFRITSNGIDHGSYHYDERPVVIGPISTDTILQSLRVSDAQDPTCWTLGAVGLLCGQCAIDSLTIFDATSQGDGTYSATIDFDAGADIDSFLLYSGTVLVGQYAYADLPLMLSGLPSRNRPEELLRVCYAVDTLCCTAIEFTLEDCSPCILDDLVVEVIECDTNEALLIIDFHHEGTGIGGFEVVGDGQQYGQFSYDNLPVEVTVSRWSGRGHNVIIRDIDATSCMSYVYIDSIACPSDQLCTIDSFQIVDTFCMQDGQWRIGFFLSLSSVSSGGFYLYTTTDSLGPFDYTGLSAIYEMTLPFPMTDGDPTPITICDATDVICCATRMITLPDCTSSLEEVNHGGGLLAYQEGARLMIEVDQPGEIRLFDLQGRPVGSPTDIQYSLALTDLHTGLYLIQHRSDDGQVNTIKVAYVR